jgi:hypothetical protein
MSDADRGPSRGTTGICGLPGRRDGNGRPLMPRGPSDAEEYAADDDESWDEEEGDEEYEYDDEE